MIYHVGTLGRIERQRDLILDAWRGFSVLLVVLSHVFIHRFPNALSLVGETGLDADGSWTEYSYRAKHGLQIFASFAGPLGVQFFFVISGYIITKLLLLEYEQRGSISLQAFYVRRAFRILPPLWLFLAFSLVMASQEFISVTPREFAFASAFLCNAENSPCGAFFLGHLWSLAIEEQFYLTWPFLVMVFVRRSVSQLAFTLVVIFSVLAQFGLMFTSAGINNGLSFACIAAGSFYAATPRFRGWIDRSARMPLIILACVILFGRPFLPLSFPGQYRLHDLLMPFLICFVMFSSFRYRAYIEQLLVVRGLALVGLVSYGLYIWQQVFLAPSILYLRPSILQHSYFLLPIVLLSYFALERPLIRVGARLSGSLRARQSVGAPTVS